MTTHRLRVPNILAFTLMSIFAFAFSASAEESEIALPGDRGYPESISSGPDNTLYVGSLAMGGVWRVKPETGAVEPWIKPAAFGTRSILGRTWSQARTAGRAAARSGQAQDGGIRRNDE